MSLAAADEDRSTAIAMAGGTAALLLAVLLARASNVRALASSAGSAAALFELPGDDAVKNVGARLDGENLVVELDVAASLGVEGLYLDLHLSFPCSRRPSLRTWALPPELHLQFLRQPLRLPLPRPRRLPARRRSRPLPRHWEAPGFRGPRRRRRGRRPEPRPRQPSSARQCQPGMARRRGAAA